MKIFIVCSKYFYEKIPSIRIELEKQGHSITLPNSFEAPFKEEEMKKVSPEEHSAWKAAMMKKQEPKVRANDAVLVLNFEKNDQPNYIGGATFLEIFQAWNYGKKVFLYNPIPESIFCDELTAMNPTVILGDLSKIKNG